MATAAARMVFPTSRPTPRCVTGAPASPARVSASWTSWLPTSRESPRASFEDHFDTRPLTLAEVYAALAYYNDHKDEVEADFAEDERLAAEGMAQEAARREHRSGR